MTIKTNSDAHLLPRLSGFTVLRVHGPDAVAFLQAQTMNDVVTLEIGAWQWNGWLSPKGRVIALFALLRVSASELLAVLPDFPAAELAPLLRRYVFRSKVVLEPLESLAAVASDTLTQAASAADRWPDLDDAQLVLDMRGDGGPRRLVLLPADDARVGPASPSIDDSWLLADLAHGFPRLDVAQREAWTPQMLSLDRLKAFSLRKGCYPGQEIVARTHYLGQARRGLVRVAGNGLSAGEAVFDAAGGSIGGLVCVSGDGSHALAVVQLERAQRLNLAGGSPLQRLDLLGGLQRPL